jgi:hydrogenase expression/formation protein HypD
MKYVTEYRDAELVQATLREIRRIVTRPWTLMEICGGQTHAIVRHGIDRLLPAEVELVHGPGCPVCVTPLEQIDRALEIASRPDVIFCSYGDMLRVPGSGRDLFAVKAQGGDVRVVYSPLDAVKLAKANPDKEVIFTSYGDMLRVPGTSQDLFSIRANGGDVRVVYSPLDAVKIAQENPDKEVVFFAIGFETTAPANAMSVLQARALNLTNYSVLVSHVCVPPAIQAILSSPANRVQGFLAAGHVCAVMGYWEYPSLAKQYGVPIVVTGFEPLDIVQGILETVRLLEGGEVKVANAYQRAVTEEGNKPAQAVIEQVFEKRDRQWRGIGVIPQSGWGLRPAFAQFDAEIRFDVSDIQPQESPVCIAGQILQGLKKPHDCPAFAQECTPERPLGATMVSAEGACAAYYHYGRHLILEETHG